jgi:hypothetical protein
MSLIGYYRVKLTRKKFNFFEVYVPIKFSRESSMNTIVKRLCFGANAKRQVYPTCLFVKKY